MFCREIRKNTLELSSIVLLSVALFCPSFFLGNRIEVVFLAGWIDHTICCFYSTVFQLYQDDGRMLMKGCVEWNLVYG